MRCLRGSVARPRCISVALLWCLLCTAYQPAAGWHSTTDTECVSAPADWPSACLCACHMRLSGQGADAYRGTVTGLSSLVGAKHTRAGSCAADTLHLLPLLSYLQHYDRPEHPA